MESFILISILRSRRFESSRFEVRNHKFQRKFETLPSNTRPRHSRRNWDVTVTRFHHHKVPRYVYSNFTNRIDISGSLSRGFLFSFFFFFWRGGERGTHYTFQGIYIDPRPSGIKLCIKRDHFLSTEIGNWNKRSGWEEEAWLRLISASLSTGCFENK